MRILLAALALTGALALPASAADLRDFTIVNGTGYAINFIGVNPPDDKDFGENELSHDLDDGQSVNVKFGHADKGCSWNLKVTWTGYDEEVYFQDVNLCTIAKVTLKYDRESKKTTALVE
jgi:hypothetical protein